MSDERQRTGRETMTLACKAFLNLWEYLREVCGENDYARYQRHMLSRDGRLMTPAEFYLWKQRHKYARPNRCC